MLSELPIPLGRMNWEVCWEKSDCYLGKWFKRSYCSTGFFKPKKVDCFMCIYNSNFAFIRYVCILPFLWWPKFFRISWSFLPFHLMCACMHAWNLGKASELVQFVVLNRESTEVWILYHKRPCKKRAFLKRILSMPQMFRLICYCIIFITKSMTIGFSVLWTSFAISGLIIGVHVEAQAGAIVI